MENQTGLYREISNKWSNDLGLLPLLSFPEIYVLYKRENKKSTQPMNVLYIHQILIYVHELKIPEHTHPP